MYDYQIELPEIGAITPVFLGKKHPLVVKETHDKLLNYILARLKHADQQSYQDRTRFEKSDQSFLGWIALSEKEKKRKDKSESTGYPLPTTSNIPITYSHVQDTLGFFNPIFAPAGGMFRSSGKQSELKAVEVDIGKMNNDAKKYNYSREFTRGVSQLLRYNKAAYVLNWQEEKGNFTSSQEDTIYAGNSVCAVDMYNFIYDHTCPFHKIHTDAEFVATVELVSKFNLLRDVARGKYYNIGTEELNQGCVVSLYHCPSFPGLLDDNYTSSNEALDQYFFTTPVKDKDNCAERIVCWIRLNLPDFDLSRKSAPNFQLVRLEIINGSYITSLEIVADNEIPCFAGKLEDNNLDDANKSVIEHIIPLQDFASAQLNAHAAATRSSLYGLTLYDKRLFDVAQIPQGEVAGFYPVKAEGMDLDLRKAVYTIRNELDVGQTSGNIDLAMRLMRDLFPSQAAPAQIAGIDRAVDNQIMSVLQGTTRRLIAYAYELDAQIMCPMRAAMFRNLKIRTPIGGMQSADGTTTIGLKEPGADDEHLQLIIGQGLKAIDRQVVAMQLQKMYGLILQNPQIFQTLDVVALLNHWSNYLDVEDDLEQFRLPQAPQQQEPFQSTAQPVAAAQ
jgi:hypothetical protein